MKLQGKNADIAVPTNGKNLCQPWELSPQAGEGAQGIHAGPLFTHYMAQTMLGRAPGLRTSPVLLTYSIATSVSRG